MGGREFEERELSRAEVLSLPWPSAEQQAAFAAHVCWAHSWYKHLPLLTGGEFVVFLAADAGDGYSDAAPRLHYAWTTDDRRVPDPVRPSRHLDYMWRLTPADGFDRDAGPVIPAQRPTPSGGDPRLPGGGPGEVGNSVETASVSPRRFGPRSRVNPRDHWAPPARIELATFGLGILSGAISKCAGPSCFS